MSESFDPSEFLDATTTEAATKRPPLPAGAVLIGTIEEIAARSWTSKKEEAKVKAGIAFDLKVKLDISSDQTIKSLPGFETVDFITMTPGIMVDTKEDGKTLDWAPGRNGALRRWREALGMNEPGQTFSPRQMVGRMIRVKIKHRTYEGEIYDEVDSVAKV